MNPPLNRTTPLPTPSRFIPAPDLAWLRGSRFLRVTLIALGYIALVMILLAVAPIAEKTYVGLVGQLIALISVAFGSWRISRRATSRQARLAWLGIGLAFATWIVGDAYFYSYIAFTSTPPTVPAPSDFCWLLLYPLLTAGLLLLPGPALRPGAQARMLIEAGIVTGVALGMSLVFIILPTVEQNTASVLTLATNLAYPLGDIALIAALILLLIRGVDRSIRPVIIWLLTGIVAFVYADTAFLILGLHNLYASGEPAVDTFWVAGEVLCGLGAWYYLIHGDEPGPLQNWLTLIPASDPRVRAWQGFQKYVLPFLPILATIPLVGADVFFGLSRNSAALRDIVAALILTLIITRQILLNNDLVDVQTAMERSQKLDALKDQFITNVNHELRTPLMTMQTYVELLRWRSQGLPERQGHLVEEIGRTNDALVELVQSILEVRRIDLETRDFPHEAVPVQETLSQAILLLNPHEARIEERELRLDIPPELAIWGESVRVQEILMNLLSNAIKYSAVGSPVEVSASRILAKHDRRTKQLKAESLIELRVRDYGLGVPSDQIPLLFHRFVRLERDLASDVIGSGIGLYICKALAEAMEGIIWVESDGVPGQGSTFHVVLPAAEAGENTSPMREDRQLSAPASVIAQR